MNHVTKSSLFVILWNVFTFVNSQEPPEVTVYYESLCPDSKYFVTRTLHETLSILPNLNVKYVPFGKANSNGYGGFDCQHGPAECRGNIVQACGLARLPSGKAQHDFVYCSMLYPKQYELCSTRSGLSWDDIDACSQSPEGNGYHRANEVLTKGNTDGPTFVPSISFNNVFSKADSTAAFNDLKSYLCQNYQSPAC